MAKFSRCRISRDEDIILNEMGRLSEETGHEMGLVMCQDKRGRWASGTMCVGDECSVHIKHRTCPTGFKPQYHVHTHPYTPFIEPSAEDFEDALFDEVKRMCVITVARKNLMCVDMVGVHADAQVDKHTLSSAFRREWWRYDREVERAMRRGATFEEALDATGQQVEEEFPGFVGEHNVCYKKLRF